MSLTRDQWMRVLAAVAGGCLTGVAFLPQLNLWYLAWIGLAPWAWAMLESEDPREAAVSSGLAGMLFVGLTLFWLFLEWGAVPLLVLTLGYSFIFSLWGVVARNFAAEGAGWFVLGGAAFWVALEMGKQYGLWTVPTLLLAQSQAGFPPALQTLDITGQWGLSLAIAVVNLGLAWLVAEERSWRSLAWSLGLPAVLALAVFGYGYHQLGQFPEDGLEWDEGYKVALVQERSGELTDWTEDYIVEVLNRYVERVRSELNPEDEYDYIIFPEESIPVTIPYQHPEARIFTDLFRIANDYRAGLVFGSSFSSEPIGGTVGSKKGQLGSVERARRRGVEFYNGVQAIGPGSVTSGQYLKLRPVPFGETQPLGPYLRFVDFPWGGEGYSAGESLQALTTHRYEVRVGTNLCYESLYPYISRGQTKDGASVLLNLSNYTWFGEDAGPSSLANARIDTLRAVENRRYYLRASTTGYSQIIDPAGRVLDRNEEPDSSFTMTGRIGLSTTQTLYTRFGDWLAYLCLFGSLAAILVLVRREANERDADWRLLDEERLWP